jgi:Family of unknown function (DUF6498)
MIVARLLDLIATAGRQVIPLHGIFADGWQPATAIALYWLESVLLAAVAIVLCWRLQRRTSDRAIAAARADGDDAMAARLELEQQAAREAGVDPRAVLLFHGASLAIFGIFLGVILAMLIQKQHLPPFDWDEFRAAADAMMLVIGVGWAVDLVLSPSMSVAAVQSRVNACLGRWALLWLLGFVGTALLVFTGRPGAFIGLFAILKAIWEGWATLARLFGWTSLQDRQNRARQSDP